VLPFSDLLTLGSQPVQIRKIGPSCFGEQIGINRIRFRTGCRTLPINGAWIDGIDRPAMLQQKGDEQAMIGFDNASHLISALLAQDLRKPMIQLRETFWGMVNPDRTKLSTRFIKRQPIMLAVCPIDASVEHGRSPSVQTTFLSSCALLLWCSKHDFLIISCSQEPRGEARAFLIGRAGWSE
jgi:hypothetical protein